MSIVMSIEIRRIMVDSRRCLRTCAGFGWNLGWMIITLTRWSRWCLSALRFTICCSLSSSSEEIWDSSSPPPGLAELGLAQSGSNTVGWFSVIRLGLWGTSWMVVFTQALALQPILHESQFEFRFYTTVDLRTLQLEVHVQVHVNLEQVNVV